MIHGARPPEAGAAATALRMNEVKRLLRETDESVQSIVQAVGYIDISSFIRKFRKMEGLSPSQYRQMHRK